MIALDFAARLNIERYRLRFFMRLTDIADLLVVVTAIVSLFAPTLMLLRVSGRCGSCGCSRS